LSTSKVTTFGLLRISDGDVRVLVEVIMNGMVLATVEVGGYNSEKQQMKIFLFDMTPSCSNVVGRFSWIE